MLKKLVEPNKLLLNVCNTRFFGRKKAKIFFFHRDDFFEKLFLTTS